MNRLSLTSRIFVVILAVQLLLLGALAAASLDNIRREIATETRIATETARALVLATIGTLQGAVPPDRLMAALPERLVPPRHVRIAILDARDGALREPDFPAGRPGHAPGWFGRLVAPAPHETRVMVNLEGRRRGIVVISADPSAEIATMWQTGRALLGLTALAAMAQLLLIPLAVRRSLRPVATVAARLADLARGDLTARMGPVPQPDLAPLAEGVDRLGAALEQADAERARLQRQVVGRGDDERKAIARDLHDEMGPCLFGLRVEAEALREAATTPRIAGHAEAIHRIAEEIARVNRALLDDLRPAAIGMLPLSSVLQEYVAELSRRFPGIDLRLEIAPDLAEPDEATALTLFRVLQEGTTNAMRHSGAGRVTIRLWTDPAHWRMMLTDDGQGLAPDSREGTGLTGMRERITLLGGTLKLASNETGTTIEARLPRLQAGRNPWN